MDAYSRGDRVPERFVGDAADEQYYPVDKFTQNLINNYALEGIKDKADDGHPKPTGHFYLTRAVGRKVAAETICTHFSKCGDDA